MTAGDRHADRRRDDARSARGTGADATTRSLRDDLVQAREGLGRAAGDARSLLDAQVGAHPLIAVGAAAGLGFLLGGGATRHGLGLLLGVGARIAAGYVRDELAGAFDPEGDA